MLARQLGCLPAGLMLAQNRDNLLLREPASLHRSVPPAGPDSNSPWRKNSVAGQNVRKSRTVSKEVEVVERSFHAPISPKPAIRLSRKDWHSYANGAVL